MSDQAQALRQLVSSHVGPAESKFRKGSARILTVSSGKGGVGKSNFTLNFALALKSLGRKVLLFDADIGMANIDVLMGVRPRYNLYHLLKGKRTSPRSWNWARMLYLLLRGLGTCRFVLPLRRGSQLFHFADRDDF